RIPILRWLFVNFKPRPEERAFVDRAQNQSQSDLDVTVAVLDAKESRRFLGVHMARRGMQPVWIRIANRSQWPYRMNLFGIDPNYYSPYEAAAANHYSTSNIWAFGFLLLFMLPLLLVLPIRWFTARLANRKIDAFFQRQAFRLRPVLPGAVSEGFVFTALDAG